MNTLSPLSINSRTTDWSPLSPYRYGDTISPHPNSAGPVGGPNPLDTPPISTHSSANSTNESDPPAVSPHNQFNPNPQQSRQLIPRPSNLNNGNPSPPASIVRSSIGTIATNVMDERKYAMMEAALAEHHRSLQRFLTPYLREMRANPAGQNRARDKLLKLSASQFQELSTDVFDEMTRREDERKRGGPNLPGNPVPKYLLPRPNFHQKRNQARQKLSTLPAERFQFLAADVFFEQERRFPRFARSGSRAESVDRQSPSRNGFPPRSASRQTDGGRDGYRPPPSPFSGGPSPPQPSNDGSFGSDTGKPLPKMYQSNVMVPNKGTMVEEDDESSGRSMMGSVEREALEAEHRTQVEELERKLDHLMEQLQTKERQLNEAKDASETTANLQQEKNQWVDLRENLEQKIREAQNLNDSMQAELSRVRMEHADLQEDLRSRESSERSMEEELRSALEEAQRHGASMEQTLRAQIENHQRDSKRKEEKLLAQIEEHKAQNQASRMRGFEPDPAVGEWKSRCENLERELDRQRNVADEVRRDMGGHLQEMRELAQRGHEAVEREEQLMDRITELEREVADWKARCAKAKTGDLDAERVAIGKDLGSTAYAPFVSDRGAVKDVNLSHFQLSIDDLLKQARTADQRALEDGMRQVVVCVRNITSDMDGELSGNDDQQRIKLRSRLSQAANNLITATKAHGAASGLAPVALVDAAAGHLTSAVVDVVRTFKVRKVGASDDNDFGAKPAPLRTKSSLSDLSQRGMHDRNVSVNSSGGYSAYSRYSERNSNSNVTSPNAGAETGTAKPFMDMLREDDESQGDDFGSLKTDLDDQNAVLVRSIQPLVNAIRSAGPPSSTTAGLIANHVSSIDSTVRQIAAMVHSVAASGMSSKKLALDKHSRPVIDALQETVYDLSRQADRDRDNVPRLAFRVARLTKDLIWRVEKVGRGEMRLEDGVASVEL